MEFTPTTRAGYENLWAKAVILPGHDAALAQIVHRLASNKARYQTVEKATGVPWWWIAIVHEREGSANFTTYLGDGEPLNHKTTMTPKGRGPFLGPDAWENGAIDALKFMNLTQVTDWILARALYEWERYNGFGYVPHSINSPYVWAWTNLYTTGKFQESPRGSWFNAHLKDPQPGCAAMLKAMVTAGIISTPAVTTPPAPQPATHAPQSAQPSTHA